MATISDTQLLKEYKVAIYNQLSGCNELMDKFKTLHPFEYSVFRKMYVRRTSINESIEAMQFLNDKIYWFTLTFNDKRDKATIQSKRKAATTFLNDLAAFWLLVEEFGEDNGRYHIHGFLVFKYSKSFTDFREWHSRQNIVLLENNKKVSKRVYYLTNYMCKDVPRIRRSKTLVALTKTYHKNKGLIRNGFMSLATDNINACIDNNFNFF